MAYTRAGLTPFTAILIIVFTIMLLFPKFEDPNFYWHLKTGELIVTTVQLPWHDVFTYTNSGNAWGLSEWLSQVIFYLLYSAGWPEQHCNHYRTFLRPVLVYHLQNLPGTASK
ncbi:hypothetical protein [Vogesella indigofera]|uniref:hypothetical protein n=1 Tax=Vogesella indigofera TaxID=45465 RepID=UPI00234F6C49|nr:hypothetical protein [Vogesella indigofera]MDC7706759.1 hypothetical protein [Vogesella indigofera]